MIAVNLADDTLARFALAARSRTVIRGNQSTVPAPAPRGHQRRTRGARAGEHTRTGRSGVRSGRDRKSTRLNSSHLVISYAVFCLKKKKNISLHVNEQHLMTQQRITRVGVTHGAYD